MSDVRIESHAAEFAAKVARRNDVALGNMAEDIEMIAAFYGPVLNGRLIKSIKKKRLSSTHWQVRVDLPYAAYQERGMRYDGTRVVKKYSTPGTGAHYLERAGRSVSSKVSQYFSRATAHVRSSSGIAALNSKTDFKNVFGD